MSWSVTRDQEVGVQQVLCEAATPSEDELSRLLLTFQNEFQIYRERNIFRMQGIESGEDRDDWRLSPEEERA